MWIEIINWIAVGLVVGGTAELSRETPNTERINFMYTVSSLLLLVLFGIEGRWPQIIQYLVLSAFTIIGMLKNYRKTHRVSNVEISVISSDTLF